VSRRRDSFGSTVVRADYAPCPSDERTRCVLLRILYVCGRIEMSGKKDSIYGPVESCVCHAHVNRLDRILEGATSFVTLALAFNAFLLPRCLDWTRAAITHRRMMNVSFCAEGSESEKRVGTRRLYLSIQTVVSITLLTIKEFSFNDSSVSLLSIFRKSNKCISKS